MSPNRMQIVSRVVFFAIAILMIYLFISMSSNTGNNAVMTNRTAFETEINAGKVTSVVVKQAEQTPTGSVEYVLAGGSVCSFYVTNTAEIEAFLVRKGFNNYSVTEVEVSTDYSSIIIMGVMSVAMIFLVLTMIRGGQGGQNAKMMDFGKSRANMIKNSKINFSNVAGLKEEKEDFQEVVDFLKNPAKYNDLGARIPKGILLVGPPGTGKTLLAKAIAGEAGVPFFSISGSDFVEMFVGVGASRVRDLFTEAKKNKPCIVFIDEIDAVARKRGSGLGGGHDEREQTLNQLLVEMDGFSANEGIIVLAATNRADILDPAIIRPGRFDRKIAVQRPDVGAREEILKVHAKDKPLGDDVDLERVARTTVGFTGADLENLMNEAAIGAANKGSRFISRADIEKAFIKVGIGAEKKSRIISEKEKKITACHEAGHAILFHLLPGVGPVHTVSIIPTGNGAAGYTMPLPEKDEMFTTKSRMLNMIKVSLGGRIAEELIFGDVTTGAMADIKQATQIAHDMVTKYGMSEKVGMINCDDDEEVFIGRDMMKKKFGEHLSTLIDTEERRIIDECYAAAKRIIEDNMDVLHRSTELLLEKEKICQEEFEALFNKNETVSAEA